MEVKEIKQKLHQYIDTGDDKLLKLMYAIAKEYNSEEDFDSTFNEEDVKYFDERRAKRLSGENKSYNWKEAKDIITGKKKSDDV